MKVITIVMHLIPRWKWLDEINNQFARIENYNIISKRRIEFPIELVKFDAGIIKEKTT